MSGYMCVYLYTASALLESNKRAGPELSACCWVHGAWLIVGAQGMFSEPTDVIEAWTLESDRPGHESRLCLVPFVYPGSVSPSDLL